MRTPLHFHTTGILVGKAMDVTRTKFELECDTFEMLQLSHIRYADSSSCCTISSQQKGKSRKILREVSPDMGRGAMLEKRPPLSAKSIQCASLRTKNSSFHTFASKSLGILDFASPERAWMLIIRGNTTILMSKSNLTMPICDPLRVETGSGDNRIRSSPRLNPPGEDIPTQQRCNLCVRNSAKGLKSVATCVNDWRFMKATTLRRIVWSYWPHQIIQ